MFFKPFGHKRIYLDYASSTPVDHTMIRSFPRIPEDVLQANPSALHQEGVALHRVLEDARRLVAKTIGAQADEIIFTSGATESDNLAIVGSINRFLQKGISPHEIVMYTSPFEHAAVSESIKTFSDTVLVYSLPQEEGYVSVKKIVPPEQAKAILFSVVLVQNEIGTLQDIKEIAKYIRKLRKDHPNIEILFHADATQAPLYFELSVARLGIDMMTLGATKLYIPKGVGMLYKKRGVTLSPLLFGGGQEHGIRPGTEPVALIHLFSHALAYAQSQRESATEKMTALRDYFEGAIERYLPAIRLNKGGRPRAPHISYLIVPAIESELLVIELDARGIAVSSKSACKNDEEQDSSIVSLLYPNERLGALRVSLGRTTTKRDLAAVVSALQSVCKKYPSAL